MNTQTPSDSISEFGIRLTFPIYPQAQTLANILHNLRTLVLAADSYLSDWDVFAGAFCLSADNFHSVFDQEPFGADCVEVYHPDFPPDFRYPPPMRDGRPGIALVITTIMPAAYFVDNNQPPTTATEARQCFLDAVTENLPTPYDVAYAWEIGPENLAEPNMCGQYAVNNHLYGTPDISHMLEALESLTHIVAVTELDDAIGM